MTEEPNGGGNGHRAGRDVALWTGFTAFVANLLGVGVIKTLGEEGNTSIQLALALFVSLLVAAGAYGRERLRLAKEAEERIKAAEWDGTERRHYDAGRGRPRGTRRSKGRGR